jgi:hypothetical protein
MAKTSESDVWEEDPPGGGRAAFVKWTPKVTKLTSKAKIVRDDWDDDDDDEGQERAVVDEQHGDTTATTSGTKTDGMAPKEAKEDNSTIWAEAMHWHGERPPSRVVLSLVALAHTGGSNAVTGDYRCPSSSSHPRARVRARRLFHPLRSNRRCAYSNGRPQPAPIIPGW